MGCTTDSAKGYPGANAHLDLPQGVSPSCWKLTYDEKQRGGSSFDHAAAGKLSGGISEHPVHGKEGLEGDPSQQVLSRGAGTRGSYKVL